MEKTNKASSIVAAISSIMAVVMFVCVKYIVPPCSGMVELANGKEAFMKCHYTAAVVALIAVIMLVNGIVAVATKQNLACGIMLIVMAVVIYMLFNDSIGIGICMKPEMACHVMAPCVKVCAAIEAVLGLVMIIFAKKN